MDTQIQETQRKRFHFLQKLYEVTQGSQDEVINLNEFNEVLGFSRDETYKIFNYLTEEGLTKSKYLGGFICITHQGIVAVEEALSKPNESTSFFPSLNYINIGTMVSSQIQQGTNQSTQKLVNNFDKIDLVRLIEEIKKNLSDLKLDASLHSEVQADVTTIEAQISSPRPKNSIIRECLVSLRAIFEGIAGNVVASLLVQQINTCIK